MTKNNRNFITALLMVAVFIAGYALAQTKNAKNSFGTPKTVIHFVSLKWKADASAADKQKALDGIKAMAGQIPGIKNVWLKTIRVQPQDYNATFAIEFQSQDAADVYRDHPAHKEWEKQYLAVREESRSGQAGN
jgi:Stress responsive A/B Barrel Domain